MSPKMRRAAWPVVTAYLLAAIIYIIILHNEHSKGFGVCCKWESPGLHPVLMAFAFVWLGPWASMGYASLEWVGGLSHSQAKMAHLAMHTLALICGWLGFASKYEGSENGGVAHFRSVHSLIGILVLVGYTLQWFVGAIVFIPSGVDPVYKRFVHGWHGPTGLTIMVLSFTTVVTGALTYTGKTSDANYSQENFNAYVLVSFLLIPLGILIVHITTSRQHASKGGELSDGQERAKMLNSTGSKSGWP
eukprot:m.42455 g.42455  ORF g.42455 m.42455 type:complete len:247 (-) comp14494_c0_seq1:147-887(-)